MTYTKWMRHLGIAVCLSLSTTAWAAATTAPTISVQDMVAASSAANTANQDKEDDPAFAVPTVTSPIGKTEIHNLEIVDQDGRWLVSDKALAMYGVKPAKEAKGTYWFQLPKVPGTMEPAKKVALQLPGEKADTGRTINIKHVRHPLGISYVLNPTSMELLPPQTPVTDTLTLKPLAETTPAPAVTKKGKMGTVLFWDPVMNEQQSLPSLDTAQPVMSPCAFRLGKDGIELRNPDFDMLAESYAAKGYAMWPLVDNQFDPDLTHEILGNSKLQDQLIDELVGYALLYQFKGYNLDFENVRYADKDKLTAFVKKISDAVHAHGIQLSMDVTPVSDSPNWSLVYDRQALAPSLDYMMVMAYDQVGRTSPVAGPAATYPWVEQAVQNMTKLVPPEKILLGMPLYMRLWYESNDGKDLPKDVNDWPALATDAKAVTTASKQVLPYHPMTAGVSVRPVALDQTLPALPAVSAQRQAMELPADAYTQSTAVKQGKTKLFVRTLTMADSDVIRKKFHKDIHWDDTLKLYYAELPLVTGTVKIWFEDEASLKEKAKLIQTYHLGGAAFWRKGFEPASFWQGFAKHELT